MTSTPSTRSADRSGSQARTGWVGWLLFAGIMLILVGAFQLIDGLIALFNDELYFVRPQRPEHQRRLHRLGLDPPAARHPADRRGLRRLLRQGLGRTLGVAALLSAIVNFAFIPAYPVWSLLIITVDILVIYALIAHGGELRKDRY